MLRACLYARVSTNDKGQDPDNQLLRLRELCQAMQWPIMIEYVDFASGKSSDRAEFKRMMDGASKREFDLVVFWSLDRFSREGALETLQHLQRLTRWGVAYRSFSEPYLDSLGPFREAIVSLLAVLAKQERTRLKERVIAGMRRYKDDMAAGRIGKEKASRTGKNLPSGRPRAKFNRNEAARLLAEGWTMRQVAKEMGVSAATICIEMKKYKPERKLPTIEEMSGSVPGITEGKSLKEYLDQISDE